MANIDLLGLYKFERIKMSNVIHRSIVVASLVIVLIFGISTFTGCVHSNSSTHYQPQDPAIGQASLKAIKVGTTTKDELLGIFGAPSGQSASADGTETFKYNYGKNKSGNFEVWPFVDLHDNKEERMTICFEVKNGIVTKYWKEP
jgi:outer membrane protein assembly factor BamE (lipoprotein component of BamABCDE complex)